MDFKGLTLDKFQEDAIHAIENNKSVIVSAPTGSGKTLIADYIINRDVKENIKVIYTAPIKALSNQKYKDFCKEYGEEKVGLLTGDIVKNPAGLVLVMTTEIYRNMVLLRDPLINEVSYVIFDEIHYINDRERGYVWEESVIFSPDHIRILGLSATIPNADEFADWIRSIKNHEVKVISHHVRSVPLHVKFYDGELGMTTLKEINEVDSLPDYKYLMGRQKRRKPRTKPPYHDQLIPEIKKQTPLLYFTFSRSDCQKKAVELRRKNLFGHDKEISAYVRDKLKEAPPELNKLTSVMLLRELLPQGIGFHHAGLLPIMKELVEELFGKGLLKVLYTTETFAVGINMPAKAVCFNSLRKFDGIEFRMLNSKEFFQIAGRAGRRGIDKEGFVYVMIDRRNFDYKKISKLTSEDTEPIKSQFKLSVNTVLNLIKNHSEEEIKEILAKNFYSYQKFGKEYNEKTNYRSHATFANLKKKLEKLHYVKENKLTDKGEFSSKVYADEILLGEIFATHIYQELNEYQLLLLLASISYEAKEFDKFFKTFDSKLLKELKKVIKKDHYLSKEIKLRDVEHMTSMIHPIYNGKDFFAMLDNVSFDEGDLMRFLRQVMDRIGQVIDATPDRRLQDMLHNCKNLLKDSMNDVDQI